METDVARPSGIPTSCVRALQRAGLVTAPLPHQLVAIRWMVDKEGKVRCLRHEIQLGRVGGILADDMGLGKTLVILALEQLGQLIETVPDAPGRTWQQNPDRAPTLIVVPPGLICQWGHEIQRHTALDFDSQVVVLHGTKRREWTWDKLVAAKIRIVLTTYETVRTDYANLSSSARSSMDEPPSKRQRTETTPGTPTLFEGEWYRIVLDEAHKIRNRSTATAAAIFALKSQRRWCLTGTPLNNRESDVASLCEFIGVSPYNTLDWWMGASTSLLSKWRAQFVLRRTESILNLPPLVRRNLHVTLSETEMRFYTSLEEKAMTSFQDYLAAEAADRFYQANLLLVWLLRLRQASCHPLLVLGRKFTLQYARIAAKKQSKTESTDPVCGYCKAVLGESEAGDRVLECKHTICSECVARKHVDCMLCSMANDLKHVDRVDISSSKTNMLIKWLREKMEREMDPETKKSTTKVVVFSQWTSYLDLLEAVLYGAKITYARLDGDIHSMKKRDTIVREFQEDATTTVLLCSLQVGGQGLNLVSSTGVVLMDPWFNPAVERQAIKRVHRIGQTRPVEAISLPTNTVIEGVLETLKAEKQHKAQRIIGSRMDGLSNEQTMKEAEEGANRPNMSDLVRIFTNICKRNGGGSSSSSGMRTRSSANGGGKPGNYTRGSGLSGLKRKRGFV